MWIGNLEKRREERVLWDKKQITTLLLRQNLITMTCRESMEWKSYSDVVILSPAMQLIERNGVKFGGWRQWWCRELEGVCNVRGKSYLMSISRSFCWQNHCNKVFCCQAKKTLIGNALCMFCTFTDHKICLVLSCCVHSTPLHSTPFYREWLYHLMPIPNQKS